MHQPRVQATFKVPPPMEMPPPASALRHPRQDHTFTRPYSMRPFECPDELVTGQDVYAVAGHTYNAAIGRQRTPYGIIRTEGSGGVVGSRAADEWKAATVVSGCPQNLEKPPADATGERWLFVSPLDGKEKGKLVYLKGKKLSLRIIEDKIE